MPAEKIKTLDMKKYQREYRQIYYRKNIEAERKRQRDNYHKKKLEKGFMPLPPHRNGCKLDVKDLGILKKVHSKFIITFD